jgi:hypothetical protein|tara:strand:+ start:119 stop:319 length:201 start_codon:yes stop_codon:yes gene_type:complete
LASPEQELKKKFYDIINAEDWDEQEMPERPAIHDGDVPLGDIMIPTPIPGVWIHVNLGFEIEDDTW